jgi:SAM-dependent methyltransferase
MRPDPGAEGLPPVQQGIQRVYDEAAGYYRNLRWEKNRLTRFEHGITRQVLEEELGPARVARGLELGCGPGTWTGLLAERAGAVVAVDLSPGMLRQAREAETRPNVTFVNADISSFTSAEAFDRVISVRVLEYVPEWTRVAARLRDLTRPGGRAVIVTKTRVSAWRGTGRERWFGPHTLARTITGRQLNQDFWQRHIPVADMVRAIEVAGFVDVKVRPVIFGLPIFVRGTKQYPIVPSWLEPPVLAASAAAWRWSTRRGPGLRRALLLFSESYAVSGRRE